jgi:hypothetical protein
LLIIFGTGFANDLKILATSDSGNRLTKIGSAITYLFGAMGIFAGLIGLMVGLLYTKAPKFSKVCACFVSNKFNEGYPFHKMYYENNRGTTYLYIE